MIGVPSALSFACNFLVHRYAASLDFAVKHVRETLHPAHGGILRRLTVAEHRRTQGIVPEFLVEIFDVSEVNVTAFQQAQCGRGDLCRKVQKLPHRKCRAVYPDDADIRLRFLRGLREKR